MSTVSFEYLQSIQGVANGLATLGADGTVPVSQLPDGLLNNYKGEFADADALTAAYPTASQGSYAFVTASGYYCWNAQLATPAWVSQSITATDYLSLTTEAKTGVNYIIVP